MVGPPRSGLATLAIVYREPEAAVLISMLRAYGIPAIDHTFFFRTLNWHLTIGLGGIAVLVPASELSAAAALVGDPAEIPDPPPPFRGGVAINLILVVALTLVPLFVLGVSGLILPPRVRGVYARP